MDKHDDDVAVPVISESSGNSTDLIASETLNENLGCGGEDGGEIMVEVVGSDVFVDGVGGDEMGENGDLGVWGDGVVDGRVREGEVEIGVNGLEEIAGSSGDKVVDVVVKRDEAGVDGLEEIAGSSGGKVVDVVVKRDRVVVNEDVVMEEFGIVEKEGVVEKDVNLERGESVTERDDVICILATPSAREDSDMNGDATNCDARIVEEDEKVVVNEGSEKCEKVIERDGVDCILNTTSAREDTDMHGDAINCASEVVEEDAKVVANEDAFGRRVHVIERDDVSCELATTSSHEDTDMLGDAMNCDTEVVEKDVKVVVNEDSEKCEKVTARDGGDCMLTTTSAREDTDMHEDAMNFNTKVVEEDGKVVICEDSETCETLSARDGVSCILTTTSACEDTDMHGDALNCASEVFEDDVKVAANEDTFGRGENVIGKADVSCELATISAHEDSGMHGDAVNGADKVSAGDTLVVTGSSNGNTRVVAENLASVANENSTEAVKFLGEILEIGVLGDEVSNAHILDDMGSSDKSVETAKSTRLSEDDGNIDEGTQTSIDLVSTIEHSEIVSGSNEAFDNKVLNSDRDMNGDAMNCDTKVVEEDAKVVVNEDSEKCGKVTARDGVDCMLTTTSAREDTDMHGDAMNFDTKLVEEDVKVVMSEDSEKCEAVTARDGGSCISTFTSACEDTDGSAMNCASEVFEEDVKVADNEDAFGRGENVTEKDDVSFELATISAHEDSAMYGDVVNGAAEVSAGDSVVVTGSSNGNTRVVAEKLVSVANEGIAEEAVKSLGEVLENQMMPEIGVLGDEASNAHVLDDMGSSDKSVETAKRTGLSENDGYIDKGTQTSINMVSTIEHSEIVTGSSEAIDNKVINSVSNMHGDAMNCYTKVVETFVKVVVNEDSEKCEKVNERVGVDCMLNTTSAREDTDLHGDAMNCACEGVQEHVKVVANEDALGRGENVIERDDVICELATTSAHEDSAMCGDAVKVAGEVSAGDTLVVTGPPDANTRVVAEKRVSIANVDGAEEAVNSLGEVLENQMTPEIGIFGDEALNAHVLDDMGSSDKSVETANRTGLREDDGNIDEGTQTSIDLVSTIEHSEIVTGSSEAIDIKVLHSDKDVISGDHNILTIESEGMLFEKTECAGGNELTVEDLRGSSRSDIALCSDPESGGKQILDENKLLLDDSLLANPLAEVSETKVDRRETTCPDTGKDVEHVNIPETDVSGVRFKVAIDSTDDGSVADASNGNLSSFVQRVTADSSSEIDVALATCLERSSHDADEATAMSRNVGDTNMKVATTVMDVIFGSEDIQDVKCDPSEKDGAAPINEENLDKQAVDSEILLEAMEVEKALTSELNIFSNNESFPREDQQLKAVRSARNDVLKRQGNMGTLVEGIVVAGADTTVLDEEVKLSDSKTGVLEGDTRLAENKNFNSLIADGISPMDEENKDVIQKLNVKQSGTLICDDDPDKVFNQLPTEMLDKGDSDPALARVGGVTSGTQAVLSTDMLHTVGEAVHCVTDISSHLLDGNRSSDVNVMCNDISLIPEEDTRGVYVSEGVTPNEDVDLAIKRSGNEPILGSMVEFSGTCAGEEGKKLQGGHLEEDISLPYDSNSIDSNVKGTKGDFYLQIRECLGASSTGNFVGISSVQDHLLEVEEAYNEKHVDLRKMQDTEVVDKAMEVEQSEDFDEKISEQISPRFGSLFSDCHSHYLPPPKTEGEFSASDLVWGKVRNHPWWPGQICNPVDASENAMKYHKKDCFLVSYFGDRTFAWNDASQLRPFRTHFSQIKKQSNSEAFHHAVSCALAEVSRRVELGLACSCIPKNSFAEIEAQIVENTGIRQEAGKRYGVDGSTAASCFEPEELLEHIRSLALFPSAGSDVLLQLVISKAQLSAFSRFKGECSLSEFHLCGGLLEKDANTDVVQHHSEQIKGVNNFGSKRNHDFIDNLLPRKKERSMSDLIDDKPHSDGEDELDSNIEDKSVTLSAGRKRKALDFLTDGSDKRQSYHAAKASTTASQTPKPSFNVGECIRRVASQLTGSPSLVKCNSEKFLKIDDSVVQHPGFDEALQTPVNSQRGRMMLSPEHSSIDEMLSQLYLAAQDPMKGYSFLSNITSFFSDFRHSVALGQNSRMRNLSTGRGTRKKKTPNSIINSPEDFEFDDINDSYWTDRIVQNYGEDQLLNSAQNGEAEYQLVLHEADKPLKSSRRPRKQFSNGEHLVVAEEPTAEHIDRKQDCSPTELILNFAAGYSVPTELNLNKIFRRFGPLRECETEVDRDTRRARVVYKRGSDAEVALSSAGKFNIFGPMHVNYELSYVPSAPYKPLPVAALEGEVNAS